MTLKGDLINNAFEEIRISGITVDAQSGDKEKALNRLETMLAEWVERDICIGYNFEDAPNLNSVHNIERKFWYAVEMNLIPRILSIYGKEMTANLATQQRGSFSFISGATARIRQTPYPPRMPVGSGNSLRCNRFRKYYGKTEQAPISCETIRMYVGNIDDFTEHFDAYLNASETISSYTIEADTGLTIVSSSNSTPDIDYTISAVGVSSDSVQSLFQVKIKVITSDAREEIRVINFELTTPPEIA